MATVLAVVQARVGSTRLPGKVMYPLDGRPVLEHITERVARADRIDDVVVATSTEPQDEVIADYVRSIGFDVVRGSESNLLRRFERVVEQYDPEIVVRITGDNPLVLPEFADLCVDRLQAADADYVNEGPNRTFPLGTPCEAFTTASFDRVRTVATTPQQREHATLCYKQQPEKFETAVVTSDELFEEAWLRNRAELRLTLDEPADYELFRRLYDAIPYETHLDVRDAIEYIDENGLETINDHVEQKSI